MKSEIVHILERKSDQSDKNHLKKAISWYTLHSNCYAKKSEMQ